jgi:hypothetical protein
MHLSDNQSAFLELVRAGLWEEDVRLAQYQEIDLNAIYKYAEEQAVQGLVAAGLEHVEDIKLPKEGVLMFVGSALQLEQRNAAMNAFIANTVEKLREVDIYALLVKGQGIAQCYERPLWRASGDVDFLLSNDNYKKAKEYLLPLASSVDIEDKNRLHLGMMVDSWEVELHGTLKTEISRRMNAVIDDVHRSIFYGGNVRSWMNDGTMVFLPDANNDVVIIFTHFIDHFYGEGIGLRQVCDWCRLLWTYRGQINIELLKQRVQKAGLLSEWKAFAYLAVHYLGMPEDIMPFYVKSERFKRKARKICLLIFEAGNFGHNKDNSYRTNSSKNKGYLVTFFRRLNEFGRLSMIFPANAPRFFVTYLINRLRFNFS